MDKDATCGSEVVIVVVGKSLLLSLDDLLLHLSKLVLWDDNLVRGEQRRLNQGEVGVVDEAAEEPDERLFELVVALGRDIVVLEVLLAVERDLLRLHLTVTDVDLVANEDDGDRLANAGQVLVPLGHVGVSDARAHIEHDDTAVAANVVSVAETTELFLAGRVPHVEVDLAVVSEEGHWVNLDTKSGDVPLLEFTSQVALNEGGLADTTVTNENELELGNLLLLLFNHLKERRRGELF